MAKPWYSVYRNFDDDALATLASAGLLRRAAKDVEAGKVEWQELSGDSAGSVRADGQIVRLTASGPQHAQCDCPAPGICKHILAAALWLRHLPPDDAAPAASRDDGNETQSAGEGAINVIQEVLALDLEPIFKACGRAAARQAADMLSRPGISVTVGDNHLLVAFPGSAGTCRYVGGAGFAGMVSDMAPAIRPARHLAALLAVWRDHGRSIPWPERIDTATKDEGPDRLSESERQFVRQVKELLCELCESGLSHVSDMLSGQIRAVNMSARSESLPRLAGMLRTLAGTVRLLARRDYQADERQAIMLAARIYALCNALENAEGGNLAALRGRPKREFTDSGSLDLFPLGAYWWESRGGARGLTVSFWEAATSRIMQAVLARPDATDTSFDRKSAWSRQILWQGAGPADAACRSSLHLSSARLSDDGRIGVGGDTRAKPGAPWTADDPRWVQAGFDDWAAVADALRASAGLTGEPLDCVLLKPESIRPPRLDEVRQVFEWPLLDRHGNVVTLRLPCEEQYRRRIENIERIAAANAGIRAVLARVDRDVRAGALEPVALIKADGDRLISISLDFESMKEGKQAFALAGRILRLLKTGRAPSVAPAASLATRVLTPVLGTLEHKLMTGRMALDHIERESLSQNEEAIRSTGLDVVAHAMRAFLTAPSSGRALQLLYLCLLCIDLDASFGFSGRAQSHRPDA